METNNQEQIEKLRNEGIAMLKHEANSCRNMAMVAACIIALLLASAYCMTLKAQNELGRINASPLFNLQIIKKNTFQNKPLGQDFISLTDDTSKSKKLFEFLEKYEKYALEIQNNKNTAYVPNESQTNSPQIIIPENISVNITGSPQPTPPANTDVQKANEILIKAQLELPTNQYEQLAAALNNNLENLEKKLVRPDCNNTDYLKLLKWLAFYVLLFFITLFLARVLRYYILLWRHYKDRHMAFQLHLKTNIPLNEALLMVSAANIDFKTPKMSTDLLLAFYKPDKPACCCCCCCDCKGKCHEEKDKQGA